MSPVEVIFSDKALRGGIGRFEDDLRPFETVLATVEAKMAVAAVDAQKVTWGYGAQSLDLFGNAAEEAGRYDKINAALFENGLP